MRASFSGFGAMEEYELVDEFSADVSRPLIALMSMTK
jgi:hypothetical protein